MYPLSGRKEWKLMAENVLRGIGVSEGVRIGRVFQYRRAADENAGQNIAQADVEKETARLIRAVEQAKAEAVSLAAHSSAVLGQDKIGVIKGQVSILADPAYCPEMEKLIRTRLVSADKAVRQVTDKFVKIFENMKNEYMKERASDIRDAGYRLLNILAGRAGGLSRIERPIILVADDLMPSDTISLDKERVLAFVTEKGGKTAHTSIFAKSMGIPAVVGVEGLLDATVADETVIVDGGEGICIIRPKPETLREYEARMTREREEQHVFEHFTHSPAATRDGVAVAVAANIGSSSDVEFSLRQGAEGVGLMRTEQLYLSRGSAPDEEVQFEEYRKIAQAYGSREVIIRTMDIGGDKEVPYLPVSDEQNPFLGNRAIRLCLNQKALFLTQLRAILRAGAYGHIKIMFPMISGIGELREAKQAVAEAKAQLKARGAAFSESIPTGIMIEVPSAALMSETLAREADFFSIGTNDLTQYTLAVDRGNKQVAGLYDYCHPAVIRLIKTVSDAAHGGRIPVGMCGGMAGDPLAIPLLVGLNLDELSMAAGAIPKAKYVIGSVLRQDCWKLADSVAACSTPEEVRERLGGFYHSHLDR